MVLLGSMPNPIEAAQVCILEGKEEKPVKCLMSSVKEEGEGEEEDVGAVISGALGGEAEG
jgi:hypothetical protein